MNIKNKYILRAKISEKKFRQLLKLFVHDLDAQTIADLANVNRNTANRYLRIIRIRLSEICLRDLPDSHQELFLPPSTGHQYILNLPKYRFKKSQVFGIAKNGNKILTQIAPPSIVPALQMLIRGYVPSDRMVRIVKFCNCQSLVDMGCGKQYRIAVGANKDNGMNSIDMMEAFWSFAKLRLSKFYGVAESAFNLYLKECEFRFNHRDENLYRMLLAAFRERPLS